MRSIYLLLLLLFISCVEQPHNVTPVEVSEIKCIVLCEGLMGMDNSELSVIDQKLNIQNNYFENNNLSKLGDTANDIFLRNDTAFVALTGSGVIEILQISTGKSIKRIFRDNFYPRNIAEINGELLITDLYSEKVFKLDKYFQLSEVITNGLKNPEGIAVKNDYIYVANSGLGVFYQDHILSGKVSIFSANDFQKIKDVYVGPNVQEIVITSHNKVIISYYNTYEKDSVGGIAIYNDLLLSKEIFRKKIDNKAITLNEQEDKLYFIKQLPPGSDDFSSEIASINLIDYTETTVLKNYANNEFWYSLAIDENYIYIGNAKNLQINGSVEIYNHSGVEIIELQSGVNPGKIVFIPQ